jgi:hypothetical protein
MRPAFRQQARFRRSGLFLQMGEDRLNHRRILDAGDDPDRTTAFPARLDVDIAMRTYSSIRGSVSPSPVGGFKPSCA